MKKPAYKSLISLFSALVILLAALAVAWVIPKMLPATSSPDNSDREVAVPAGIRQVVCPGMLGSAQAWVQGTSAEGAAELTDSSAKIILSLIHI